MEQHLFETEIQEIIHCVDDLRTQGVNPVVIAIDGMAASGKTTLSALLAEQLDAAVVHMDDFFLPQGFRTPERLRTPGGNVYYERFKQEVVPYLHSGVLFGYRVFDAHAHQYVDTRLVEPKSVIVVEGSYSCHPEIGDIYDLRLFCSVSPYEQTLRIQTTRPQRADMFAAMWIPMENRYFEAYSTKEQADMVITSGAPQPEMPLEIERKFLIRMPDELTLTQNSARVLQLEQVYLKGAAPGVNVRIRKSVENGEVTYFKTEKKRISNLVREEREIVIDDHHYQILLGFADEELKPICKTRYCVPMGELTAEIDVFPFWTDRAFCEVELPAEDTTFTLPAWIQVIREVTDDRRYTNAALAKEVPMERID